MSVRANKSQSSRTAEKLIDALFLRPLPHRLKLFRLHRDLSQRQLAIISGLSPATISQIEGGQMRGVDLRTFYHLCIALGVTPNDLSGYNGVPPAGFPRQKTAQAAAKIAALLVS